ncbi:MAG: tRNA glutamyl-Q(34) synthetase GluQRS [Rhodospirillales bacterium]|jgi:glutamyl-Q tRNA(Asp) synthetase
MNNSKPVVTRFAPSPTGHLHLGHAYSAWFAQQAAQVSGGRFLLRIEDIDQTRCLPEFERVILDDLDWLGLSWEEPVRRQSDHMADYAAALAELDEIGLIYPCFCSRKEIRAEIKRINEAPHDRPEDKRGPVYPGTCRSLTPDERDMRKSADDVYALRLDTQKAVHLAEQKRGNLSWMDLDRGEQRAAPEIFGDVVLARRDEPTSYHLSVTVDDALQGINLITRGEDLRDVTHVHCLLQALLDYETPAYRFHHLLTDAEGKRFAKRDKSLTLQTLREEGKTLEDIKAMAGWV